MKRSIALTVCLLILACPLRAENRIDPRRAYPRFQVGVTGIHATIEPGLVVTVADVEAGSPAAGVIETGDVILAAGGRATNAPDPRVPLGEALGAAEAKDGRLVLKVRRGGAERELAVTVPVLGPYSPTWPRNCAKSRKIIRQTAEFLAAAQQPDGAYRLGRQTDRDGLAACMAGLFLLSTGEAKYLPNVRLQARQLAAKVEKQPTGSTWHLGVQGILLGEYYLRTGDRAVLGGLKALCDQAALTQNAGAWGHGAGVNPGYVQSGLMNSAGVPVLTTLILARECGVPVPKHAFEKALWFFYRMAGHGCVCYGDHRSELFPNTNGRNGMLACALGLLGAEPYTSAAQHLALLLADSYYAPEFGHTGGGFNVMWRGLATVLVPPARQSHYRRQMDRLAWYYDLARVRGGGFSMLPSPPNTTRYCGLMWGTGAVGLTYTAPLRTLRITGAPPTKYSVRRPAPPVPWGNAADRQFLRTDDCEGFGRETAAPHEIHAALRGRDMPPVAFCAKMLRHFSPLVRTWAARKLAERADAAAIDALVAALGHTDARVRRAACDGISGYDNWGRPTSPARLRGKVPPEVVSRRCVPLLVARLKDPAAAWWEIDGALWAFGRARPEEIRRHLPLLRRFAAHEDWYIREAAFWAQVGLREQITGEEFDYLAQMYARERHVFARSSFDAGFNFLLKGSKVRLPEPARARAAKILGRTIPDPLVAEGYGTGGKHEAAHRTMMILKHFDPPVYRYMVDDFVRYLQTWSPDYQHSEWLITGSPWQVGLVKVAEQLGPDAAPLIAAFRRCLDRQIPAGSTKKAHVACRKKLEEAVAAWERKYGRK